MVNWADLVYYSSRCWSNYYDKKFCCTPSLALTSHRFLTFLTFLHAFLERFPSLSILVGFFQFNCRDSELQLIDIFATTSSSTSSLPVSS